MLGLHVFHSLNAATLKNRQEKMEIHNLQVLYVFSFMAYF